MNFNSLVYFDRQIQFFCHQICRFDAAGVLAAEHGPPDQAAEGGRRRAGHGGGLGRRQGPVLGIQPSDDAAQPLEEGGLAGTNPGETRGAQGGAQVKLLIPDCEANKVIVNEIHATVALNYYVVLVNNAQTYRYDVPIQITLSCGLPQKINPIRSRLSLLRQDTQAVSVL